MFILLTTFLLFQSCHKSLETDSKLLKSDVIYGEDNRTLIKSNDLKKKKLAESVATMVFNWKMRAAPRKPNYQKVTKTPAHIAYDVCLSERYAKKNILGACTGFLIGDDLLLTAGHCLSDQDTCNNVSWVFNRTTDSPYIENEKIYKCKEILETGIYKDDYLDYTLIRLERRVSSATPLKLATKEKVHRGDQVYSIGHPFGLPLIVSDDAFVTSPISTYDQFFIYAENPHDEDKDILLNPSDYFMANLDVFKGNSGSPVFNKENEVIGMISSGSEDWVYSDQFCNESIVKKDDEKETELILHLKSIKTLK